MIVGEILQLKGNTLYTATPETPLSQVVATMAEKDIGSLVVMSGGALAGMLTFRELILTLHEQGGSVGDAPIGLVTEGARYRIEQIGKIELLCVNGNCS